MNHSQTIVPKDYQINIIQKVRNYFQTISNKCVISMPCGSGKTFTSLLIAKEMKCKNILVFVPSVILKKQWNDNITKLSFDSDTVFTVSTYRNSSNILKDSLERGIMYDIILFDECHHISNKITISDDNMMFTNSLKINTTHKLFVTATFKKEVNDNISIFGNLIINRNTKWAIENNIICDYRIEVFIYEKKSIDYESKLKANRIFIDTNELYVAAKAALDKILNRSSKYILIYTNTIKSSEEVIIYVRQLLNQNKYSSLINLNYISYTSNTSSLYKNRLDDVFKSDNAIISCVYSLGEGVDLPLLDTVIFGEKMSSDIRIVQSSLRPCRLHPSKTIATIFIPVLCDNSKAFPSEFKKVRKVILSMIDGDEEFVKQRIEVRSNNEKKDNFLNTDSDKLWDKIDTSKIFNNLVLDKNSFKRICDKEFFLDYDFSFCKIIECKIENSNIDKKNSSLNGLVLYLYTKINDVDCILKETTYGNKSIIIGKHKDNKVPYVKSLNISVRNKCANDCVKEIYTLCENLNIQIYLKIKLDKGPEVRYIK